MRSCVCSPLARCVRCLCFLFASAYSHTSECPVGPSLFWMLSFSAHLAILALAHGCRGGPEAQELYHKPPLCQLVHELVEVLVPCTNALHCSYAEHVPPTPHRATSWRMRMRSTSCNRPSCCPTRSVRSNRSRMRQRQRLTKRVRATSLWPTTPPCCTLWCVHVA